jgi:hypothetical protein
MELKSDFVLRPLPDITRRSVFRFKHGHRRPRLPLGRCRIFPGLGPVQVSMSSGVRTARRDKITFWDSISPKRFLRSKIKVPIPNRGLLQPDINMFGVTYLQQN